MNLIQKESANAKINSIDSVSNGEQVQLRKSPSLAHSHDKLLLDDPEKPRPVNMNDRDLNKQFDSYASVKTYATGFFNLALLTTNAVQLKQLLSTTSLSSNGLNILLVTCVCLSLLLQVAVALLLIFLAKQSEFVDEEKRKTLVRGNNWATLLISTVSILNVFINIFISV